MPRSIEVELRYPVIGNINSIPLKFTQQKHIVDTYLDTREGKYYIQGVFIRNRNNSKFDIKFNIENFLDENLLNEHTHCDEYSFNLPLTSSDSSQFEELSNILHMDLPSELTLNNLIEANNFVPLVIVDKKRNITNDSGFEISFDEIKNAGNFIEIEKLIQIKDGDKDESDNIEQTKVDIERYAKSLGINVAPFESGYVELCLKETNPELYLKGKYLLTEDKK